jgi:hypothetical protein
MLRFRTLTLAPFALAGAIALAALPQATAAAGVRQSPTPPHIVARPNNVMVRQPIRLVGSGFPPNRTITIKECSRTNWVVNQNPCDSDNAITVTTNANGGWRGTMTAELCPATPVAAAPQPAEICYVGQPVPAGLDTIKLVGAARITVTYP